ncbi:MAG: 3'-5' exonuclease [Gemmatimonadales bacterium]
MAIMRGGVETRAEATFLATRAAQFLQNGPADPVALIGHVCNLPGAPRIVAEHMAEAIFAGRPEFSRDDAGRWVLSVARPPYETVAGRKGGGGRNSVSNAADADILASLSYVVVDVETTGGRAYGADRITEVAAVVVRDGEVCDVFESLVNPGRPIPAFISHLTNITWDMVKDAPAFSIVEPRLLDVIAGNVFAAHNANFDWRFICAEVFRASGQQLAGRRLCTVKLARKILPQLPRRSLDHVANYYGVEISGRHRAAGDAIATAHCLIRMLDDAADRGCVTWDDLDLLIGKRGLRAARMARAKRRRSALPGPARSDATA